jgi:hypothetical protein
MELANADKSEILFAKLSIGTIVLAPLCCIIWSATGMLIGEDIRGNFAFSLFVAAVLMDLGVLLALGSVPPIQALARWSWVTLSLIILGFAIYLGSTDGTEGLKAADTTLIVAMFILAFPASLVGLLAVVAYSIVQSTARESVLGDLFVYWIAFSAVGYLQWFVGVPKLVRVLARRRHAQPAK